MSSSSHMRNVKRDHAQTYDEKSQTLQPRQDSTGRAGLKQKMLAGRNSNN